MTDQDAIGLTIGRHCSYGWIISNIVHSTSGPAIRPGSSTTSDPTATATAHHLYVGGNTVSTNLQTAIWVKYGHHIIISGNDISNPLPHPVGGNPGMGMGAQYEPSHVAWIFNRVHDADFGFVSESYDVAVTNLVIGNEFYNIGLDAVSGYGGTGGEEAAFDFHGSTGSKMYIVGNTINHAVSGIHNRYDMDVYVENNIVSDLLSANSWHLMAIETANTFADHNVFYDSGGERIRWGASTYTLAQLVSNTSQGDNSLNTDPQLVSDSNLTFPDTSPAKDAGQAAASLTVDVYAMFEEWFGESIAVDRFGTARPQNSVWDIGSYEYTPGGSVTFQSGRSGGGRGGRR